MPGDPAVERQIISVRVPCGSLGCAFGPRRSRVGRFTDLCDGVAWPVLTTFASLLPRRLGGLIRGLDDESVEADPVG